MAQDGCVDKQDVCGWVLNTEKLKTINAEFLQGSPFAALQDGSVESRRHGTRTPTRARVPSA
jgi:hypothetical protein